MIGRLSFASITKTNIMKGFQAVRNLALGCMLFIGVTASAQNAIDSYDQGFRLGFGINAGYVLDDPFDFALGGDVRLQYDLTKRYSLTLTTGFTNFFVGDEGSDFGFIPVKAGFKAFVWEDRFYLLGEAGAAFAVTNRESYKGTESTSFLIAPGIGYATKYVDLSLRYEHYTDFPVVNNNNTFGSGTGQLALRLAYGFKL